MVYALWDIESNNLVAERTSLDEALELVRRGIDRNGLDSVSTLSLDVADERGEISLVAEGQKLAELAIHASGPARAAG